MIRRGFAAFAARAAIAVMILFLGFARGFGAGSPPDAPRPSGAAGRSNQAAGAAPATRSPGLPPLPTAGSAEEAAARLKSLYFRLDYDGGRREAEEYCRRFPESGEVAFWSGFIPFLGGEKEVEARRAKARERVAEHPDDPWAWLELSRALGYRGEDPEGSRRAGRKALALAPEHPDFIWWRAWRLLDEGRYSETIEFIDRARTKVENPAELLVLRSRVLEYRSMDAGSSSAIYTEASLRDLAEARRIDPSNVNAHFSAGNQLMMARRPAEAVALLQAAVRLSPDSTIVRRAYWRALASGRDPDPARKQAVEEDIRELLRRRGEIPGTVYAAARQYGAMQLPERQKEMEERVLRKWPDSREAEFVLRDRWAGYAQEVGREGLKEPRHQSEYRRMLREFIQRPVHRSDGTIAYAYISLFDSLKEDPAATDEEIVEAVDGMARYDEMNNPSTVIEGPIALADRRIHLEKAEALVHEGERQDQKYRELTRGGEADKSKEARTEERHSRALYLDALGWVHLAQGRTAEAEKELRQAWKLNPERPETACHLGRLSESKGDLPGAEAYYGKGVVMEVLGENPCEKPLRDLYVRRTGSADGFESYRDRFLAGDRAKRKEEILAARIAAPAAAPDFDLKTLDGRRQRLADLRGKVVVINFWGVWCGWCVQEMPDLQKLHDRVKSDPEVVLLTVDNDDDADMVREWIKKRGYTFPVLLDDGYVNKAAIRAFPTTWFLDREGRIAYSFSEWSANLPEEYLWRIESLKATTGG